MLSGLNDAEKNAAWVEIEQELSKFSHNGVFAGPCELVVGVGVKKSKLSTL
jgi:hypothetical protein